jgi:hypothetical protein
LSRSTRPRPATSRVFGGIGLLRNVLFDVLLSMYGYHRHVTLPAPDSCPTSLARISPPNLLPPAAARVPRAPAGRQWPCTFSWNHPSRHDWASSAGVDTHTPVHTRKQKGRGGGWRDTLMRALTRASLAGIPNDKPSAFSLLKDLCPHTGTRQPCTNFSKPHAHAMSVFW